MSVDRFPRSKCECGVEVLDAIQPSGAVVRLHHVPTETGTFDLKDTGGTRPIAVRLNVAARFGKQGRLYVQHKCTRSRVAAVAA